MHLNLLDNLQKLQFKLFFSLMRSIPATLALATMMLPSCARFIDQSAEIGTGIVTGVREGTDEIATGISLKAGEVYEDAERAIEGAEAIVDQASTVVKSALHEPEKKPTPAELMRQLEPVQQKVSDGEALNEEDQETVTMVGTSLMKNSMLYWNGPEVIEKLREKIENGDFDFEAGQDQQALVWLEKFEADLTKEKVEEDFNALSLSNQARHMGVLVFLAELSDISKLGIISTALEVINTKTTEIVVNNEENSVQ